MKTFKIKYAKPLITMHNGRWVVNNITPYPICTQPQEVIMMFMDAGDWCRARNRGLTPQDRRVHDRRKRTTG